MRRRSQRAIMEHRLLRSRMIRRDNFAARLIVYFANEIDPSPFTRLDNSFDAGPIKLRTCRRSNCRERICAARRVLASSTTPDTARSSRCGRPRYISPRLPAAAGARRAIAEPAVRENQIRAAPASPIRPASTRRGKYRLRIRLPAWLFRCGLSNSNCRVPRRGFAISSGLHANGGLPWDEVANDRLFTPTGLRLPRRDATQPRWGRTPHTRSNPG